MFASRSIVAFENFVGESCMMANRKLKPLHLRLLDSPAAVALLCVCGLATALLVYLRAVTNNDVATLLHEAEKVLGGAKLYSDIVEVNPPLIVYLNMPPVLLAWMLGVSPASTFVFYVFAFTCLSLALIWRVTDCRTPGETGWPARLTALGVLAIYTIFPSTDFGEREHLLLIFCMPYLFLTIRRVQGLSFDNYAALLIGCLAGLGFALKPHFVLAPLLLEIYLILHFRRLQFFPEALAAAFVMLVYAASILLLTPLYLQRIVPYALLVYNAGYGIGLLDIVLCWQGCLLALLTIFHFATRAKQPTPVYLDVFLIVSAVFYIAYVAQMKIFYYHLLPVSAMLFMTLLFISMSESMRNKWSGIGSVAAIIVMSTILTVPLTKGTFQTPVMEPMLQAMTAYAKGSATLALSSYNWPVYPMAALAETRTELPGIWLLPGAERRLAASRSANDLNMVRKLEEVEHYAADTVIEAFTRDRPALVIVDEHDRRFEGLAFDYIDFFSRDPRFRSLWQDYHRIGAVCAGDDIGPYGLYVRDTPVAPPAPVPGLYIHKTASAPLAPAARGSDLDRGCAAEKYD
jgi:hypothetical protein